MSAHGNLHVPAENAQSLTKLMDLTSGAEDLIRWRHEKGLRSISGHLPKKPFGGEEAALEGLLLTLAGRGARRLCSRKPLPHHLEDGYTCVAPDQGLQRVQG